MEPLSPKKPTMSSLYIFKGPPMRLSTPVISLADISESAGRRLRRRRNPMSPKRLAKQEIDVAPQLIQLGGDSHRSRTDGGAAMDRRAKEEERIDAGSSSDVSSSSVIEKILQRQNKSLRERRRNFLTTVGMHRRTTNPSLHKNGARRRRMRDEGKATHPELKAAQQLLDLSYTASSSENNSETSHVTDASSAMETRELEMNAARQMMRLGQKHPDNLKREESESSSSSSEECKSNLSSIARKRVLVEECEVFCGRRRRKFRSLVDIYRKTKAL